MPGDVVLLEAGDRVPADGRLFIAAGLEIDESALTGESQPVAKQTAALIHLGAPFGDRVNMAYMNTMLTRGRAELIVTATGVHTEMGRLSQELAAAAEAPTPLQMQLDRLGKRLGAIALTRWVCCPSWNCCAAPTWCISSWTRSRWPLPPCRRGCLSW